MQLSEKLGDHTLAQPLQEKTSEIHEALQPAIARRREVHATVQTLGKTLRTLSQISAGLSK